LKIRPLAERCWIILKEHHRGKALGAAAGLLGGWFGGAMGFVIGAMLDALLARRAIDGSVSAYMENPGPAGFAERIPGAAAFCALAVLVLEADGEADPDRIARWARGAFGTGDGNRADFESLARTAAALTGRLNPDLLAESLRARRIAAGAKDMASIRESLASLAAGPRGSELAARIGCTLVPEEPIPAEPPLGEAYELLGISPEASTDEVKAAYRRLAVAFHPDAAVGLSERQKQSAAEAFMRIDGAYRTILELRAADARKGA
jgi:DnaJ-domain-containing protein 1